MDQLSSPDSELRDQTTRTVSVVEPSNASNHPSACPSCSARDSTATPTYVYSIGKIEARFPRLSLEKEFAQAVGRADSAGKTDQQVLHQVLSLPENSYLVRQMCWVLTIQGFETFLLHPRDVRDFERLVESIRAEPSPLDLDVVIGTLGPIAPPEYCNGLMVPLVAFDQIYSFDRASLVHAIPHSGKKNAEPSEAVANEVFERILQITDNAGATDEHRALNYLAMRYPGIYAMAAEQFAKDFSLTAVDVRSAPPIGTRNVVQVVFSFTNRNTDFTEKFAVRVDVTEEFPFLVSKLFPYFDR